MKTILLKLAGPLQSWGSDSHFETRKTDRYPSKSAIVGLLAACMGYRRDEDDKIRELNSLDFAVRVEQEGVVIKDFHTAKMCDKNGSLKRTYVTNRYYLQDAIFMVALSGNDELIDKILEGLKNPYFQPFLGRRSLPLNYDFVFGLTDKGAVDSLRELKWQAKDWYKKRTAYPFVSIYADAGLLNTKLGKYRRDNVLSFSPKDRRYELRKESMEVLRFDLNGIKEEHDVFMTLEE